MKPCPICKSDDVHESENYAETTAICHDCGFSCASKHWNHLPRQKPEWLPEYKVCLTLNHNQHKVNYQTVEQYLMDHDFHDDEFESPEHRQRCIDTNEIWEASWYPLTPVGLFCVAAPTFEELVSFMKDD